MKEKQTRRPAFRSYGGEYQLYLETVEDLDRLLDLEEGRWMATSCPLFGLRIDPAFLKLVDADGNGRIISDEVRAAVRWLRERLYAGASGTAGQPHLSLALINPEHPDGPGLIQAARRTLAEAGLPDAAEISRAQVQSYQQRAAQLPFNGDGIMPPEAIEEPEAAQFARDLVAALGGATDASGRPGVDEPLLDRFAREAAAHLQWLDEGLIPEGETASAIMPFGERTAAAAGAVAAVRDKVEEFFAQCALVRFDASMAERMGLREDERAQLDYTSRQAIRERLQAAPLAPPTAEALLPLNDRVNEIYRDAVHALREQAVAPALGEDTETLSEAQWRGLLASLAPHQAWLEARPATELAGLGPDKLRAHLEAPHAAVIRSLIAQDRTLAGEVQKLHDLEKLLLYHQWLFTFANNYVSFSHLFDPGRQALFEIGTLVLEGREFSFSVRVENRTAHANLARNGSIYLLYLQISGTQPADNFEIAVPVTRGNTQGFYVGRRGVFFTAEGRELDAQIVQIVENPVSFLESMRAPLRFAQGLIARRFEQLSASTHKEVETSVGKAGAQAESSLQTGLRQVPRVADQEISGSPSAAAPVAPAPPPERSEPGRAAGNVRDVMIGMGFLLAGLGTALKFLADAARQLTNPRVVWIVLAIVAAFFVVIALFTALSAWLKLRRRDLGVLLQASGWAMNRRMRLARPLARLFTRRTPLPPGARKRHRNLPVRQSSRGESDVTGGRKPC